MHCLRSLLPCCFSFLRLFALIQFVASSHDSRLRVHCRHLRAAIEWSFIVRLVRLPRGLKRLQIDLVVTLFIVSRSGEAVSSDCECLLMAGSAFKRFVDEALLVLGCGRKQSRLPSIKPVNPRCISITHLDFALAAIVVVSRLVQSLLTQTPDRFHLSSPIVNIYSDIA